MRTFFLVVLLAVPLCLATCGCGILGNMLDAMDKDSPDDFADPIVIHSQAADVPPSAALGDPDSF